MIPLCQDQKIAVIPFSPLARGWLARKPAEETLRGQNDALIKERYDRQDNMTIIQRVGEVAEKRGVPTAQVALAWMLSRQAVTSPIIGATKPHHLEDAIAALSVQLSSEEIQYLEEAYNPHPVIGFS